jgi:hypothetical protein
MLTLQEIVAAIDALNLPEIGDCIAEQIEAASGPETKAALKSALENGIAQAIAVLEEAKSEIETAMEEVTA